MPVVRLWETFAHKRGRGYLKAVHTLPQPTGRTLLLSRNKFIGSYWPLTCDNRS